MKQSLIYDDAWERTIAEKDRKEIEEIFEKAKKHLLDETIQFTTLKTAKNYKDELLITVLIHNTTKTAFSFQGTTMQFVGENEQIIAVQTFTESRLTLKEHTSMPWTFIFQNHFANPSEHVNGYITLK